LAFLFGGRRVQGDYSGRRVQEFILLKGWAYYSNSKTGGSWVKMLGLSFGGLDFILRSIKLVPNIG